MKQLSIIFLIVISTSTYTKGQFVFEKKEIKDTAFTIPMFNVSYAYQWAASDMANRFGSNHSVGGSFLVKTKKNWLYGFKGNFIWGGEVVEPDVLTNIRTSDGSVIDNEGRLTDVYLGQRGSSFFLIGGRMVNKLAPNKNSGFLFYGGIGMLQHKISIKFQDDVASLTDELKKGYDRYSLGYALNGFVGYLYMSKNRLLNFFGGFDYTHAWTKSLRKYNYDTQETDTKLNTNILYGVRVGWILRLNKRQSQEYYYY
ncbi:MAG: hypothetical protein COA97_01840 [Flavobacteriales bacterium]|nr:MAG: hypothetical protein COA97_01840 [Flavobacteriales bacterium]